MASAPNRRPDFWGRTPDPAEQDPPYTRPPAPPTPGLGSTSRLHLGQLWFRAVAGQGHRGRWESRCWLPLSPLFLFPPPALPIFLPLAFTPPHHLSQSSSSLSFPTPLGSLFLSPLPSPPQSHSAAALVFVAPAFSSPAPLPRAPEQELSQRPGLGAQRSLWGHTRGGSSQGMRTEPLGGGSCEGEPWGEWVSCKLGQEGLGSRSRGVTDPSSLFLPSHCPPCEQPYE